MAQPLLQVVGAVRGPHRQHSAGGDGRQPVGDDLRPGALQGRQRDLLQLRPAVLGGLGCARRDLDAAHRPVLRRLRAGHAAQHHDRRPAVPRRRRLRRQLRRRAPARRRAPRPGVHGRRRQRLRAVQCYRRGALFIVYDEWGGFFDHRRPPVVADDRAAAGFGQMGFRIPAVSVSPFARNNDQPAVARRPRHLRPRVDPQVHLLPLRARLAEPPPRVRPRTSASPSTSRRRRARRPDSSTRPTCPIPRGSRHGRARSAAVRWSRTWAGPTPPTSPTSRSWPTSSGSPSGKASRATSSARPTASAKHCSARSKRPAR